MLVPRGGGASLAVDAFLHRNRVRPDSLYGGDDGEDDEEALQQGRRHPPHGVFHAHAHDMAYLEEWVGEMLNITRCIDGGKGDEARDGPPRYVFLVCWLGSNSGSK